MTDHYLTTATVANVFTEGVRIHSGRVSDSFDDGSRLFLRSLLPFVQEVRPDDRLQGGLALRATESEIWLHPYLFRQVCSNGAIMAHAVESRRVECSAFAAEDDVIRELQDAIAACCERDVFATAVDEVRTSVHAEIDMVLSLAPLLSRMRDTVSVEVMAQIVQAFSSHGEPTRFSLMNAVTSVARDTRDPEQRWRLEELGGGIGAGITPLQPMDGSGLRRTVHDMIGAK